MVQLTAERRRRICFEFLGFFWHVGMKEDMRRGEEGKEERGEGRRREDERGKQEMRLKEKGKVKRGKGKEEEEEKMCKKDMR